MARYSVEILVMRGAEGGWKTLCDYLPSAHAAIQHALGLQTRWPGRYRIVTPWGEAVELGFAAAVA
jgi:hypothetical protein